MSPTNCRTRRATDVGSRVIFALLMMVLASLPTTSALAARERQVRTEGTKEDYKANDMLKRGIELVDGGQAERGLKMVSSIPLMFPQSDVRFDAYLVLGRYYMDQGQYNLAIKQFRRVSESEDDAQRAEALFQIGVSYYHLNSYDQAFMTLRQVTTDYTWSVFANEAYYYIGLCYFQQKRWAKTYDSLRMVGTSVPPTVKGDAYAEAGQRFYVKIFDKDLVVVRKDEQKLTIDLRTDTGDRETVSIEPLDRIGEYQIGSLPTELGAAAPNDGKLQIRGGDTVTAEYIDRNTESGQVNAKRVAQIRMVSTAGLGFTDGAYRDYTYGVFADQDCFIRLKDLDLDTSDQADAVTVRVLTRYRLEREEEGGQGVELSDEIAPEYELRDSLSLTLAESEPHSGIFVGTLLPKVAENVTDVVQGDKTLSAMAGDEIAVEYVDEVHVLGQEPRMITARAKLLVGQIQDVKVEHRVVDSLELKARKDLIEAKLYLKLAEIFKDVGLLTKANEKADEGLVRVDDIISVNLEASLDRDIVEEAFSVKWNLLLVEDRLQEAISVCQTLIRLYPDSNLADQALFKIATAKAEGMDYAEALQLYSAVMRLPASELRPEAQFKIASIHEQRALESAQESGRPPDLSAALREYQKCAENFPQSNFAGDSLEKIANYYLSTEDYGRTVELLERIFQDYPDASFLDRMLLKWAFVSYKMGNYQTAKEKTEQFISEYPTSKDVEKAKKLLPIIDKKL